MKTLTEEAKAEAIKLAMRIDLGEVSTERVLSFIRKDVKVWQPILEFWGEVSPMTRLVLERLFLESSYLKS